MSESSEQRILDALQTTFPHLVEEASILKKNRVSVRVKAEGLHHIADFVKESLGYDQPVSAGGVDLIRDNLLQMVYYVDNSERHVLLMLRTNIPRDSPRIPTLTDVWDAMSYHEREAWEMFGIHFEGHPNLVNLLLPESWDGGHPLRKDFKLEGKGTDV